MRVWCFETPTGLQFLRRQLYCCPTAPGLSGSSGPSWNLGLLQMAGQPGPGGGPPAVSRRPPYAVSARCYVDFQEAGMARDWILQPGVPVEFLQWPVSPTWLAAPASPPPSIPLSSASSKANNPWPLGTSCCPTARRAPLSLSSTLTVMATWSRQMCRIWW